MASTGCTCPAFWPRCSQPVVGADEVPAIDRLDLAAQVRHMATQHLFRVDVGRPPDAL